MVLKKGQSEKGRIISNFDLLPDEIFLDIISRVSSGQYMIKYSYVCKSWFNLINNNLDVLQSKSKPRLIFNFISRYKVDDPYLSILGRTKFFQLEEKDCDDNNELNNVQDFISIGCKREFIGSCNGLVCFYIEHRKSIEVRNPTRCDISTISFPYQNQYCFGFGYASATKEYKLVCFSKSNCMVFTLGTNSWREIPSVVPPELLRIFEYFNPGKVELYSALFSNGFLYWSTEKTYEKVSFDINNETFHLIQIPKYISLDNWRYVHDNIEFKGNYCIALLELGKLRDEFDHFDMGFNGKLIIYTLMEKDNEQIWTEELFIISSSVTRARGKKIDIVGCGDDILLCWMENDKGTRVFKLYNVQRGFTSSAKCPKAIEDTYYSPYRLEDINYRITSQEQNYLFSLYTIMKKESPKSPKSVCLQGCRTKKTWDNFYHWWA